MKAGHNVWYNDTEGTDRDKDRVGQALGGIVGGRVKVQTASGGVGEFEAITHGLAEYDKDHGGNRGDCAWPV